MPRRTAPSTLRLPRRTSDPRAPQQQIVLHVSIEYIHPPIWRRVSVPESYTLHQLHRVLQVVFSRLDYHLYAFDVGKHRFERPNRESDAEKSTEFTLADLGLKAGQRFTYTYDFGDDWRHQVKVESFASTPGSPGNLPTLLAGERAAPPEDTGGPPGYEMLLQARANPEDHDAQELLGTLPVDFDPELFDRWAVGQALILAAGWGAI